MVLITLVSQFCFLVRIWHCSVVMAIDKGKLQEEEASAVTRFYNIILGWDYKQLTKENEVIHDHTKTNMNFFFFLYSVCFFHVLCNTEEKQKGF